MDGDCVWLRAASLLSIDEAPAFGHFFASLRASWLRGKTARQSREHRIVHYLKIPGDALFLVSPLVFPSGSLVLQQWVRDMERWFIPERKIQNEEGFQLLTACVRQHGFEGGIVDASVCSPLCPLWKKKLLMADSVGACNIDEMFRSMCVNNFWQSSKVLSGAQAHACGNFRAERGSAWDLLLKRALPAPTRRLRGKRSRSGKSRAHQAAMNMRPVPSTPRGHEQEDHAANSDINLETRDIGVGEALDGTLFAALPPQMRDVCVGDRFDHVGHVRSYVRTYMDVYVLTYVRASVRFCDLWGCLRTCVRFCDLWGCMYVRTCGCDLWTTTKITI